MVEYCSIDTEQHDGETEIEEFFLVSDTRGGGDYTVGTVGSVVRLESSGEILGVNWEKVILDRKHFSFLVQVIDRFQPNVAGGYVCRVLDILEFLN